MDACGVCLETILIRGKLSCCDHSFCFDCINKWSQQSNTCPICKQRFNALKKISNNGTPEEEPHKRGRKRKKEEVIKVPHRNPAMDDYWDSDWFSSEDDDTLSFDPTDFLDPMYLFVPFLLNDCYQMMSRIMRPPPSCPRVIDLTSDTDDDEERDPLFIPPRQRRPTPPRRRGSPSPPDRRRASPCPRLRRTSPSPKRRSDSPIRRPISPSPKRRSPSPKRRSSPKRRVSISPKRRASPSPPIRRRRAYLSPKRRSPSPSPKRRSPTPPRRTHTSTNRTRRSVNHNGPRRRPPYTSRRRTQQTSSDDSD